MQRAHPLRRVLAAGMLSAAVLAGLGLANPQRVWSQAAAAPAADQQTAVPVKQVVLYSSGVGYFEHFGSVKGNSSTELRFKTAQINDILKSLVLQDLDKGRVGVITYPSQDPVAKTLRSFQVDITNNPSLHALVGQLRGAKVTLVAGGETVSGTILGVEMRPQPVGGQDGKSGQVINVAFVNLITGAGIRSVSLENVASLTLDDKELQDELNRALAALAGARDQDKKPVTINLQGDGERRVRIGYVVETPVWKTSYRLVLGDKAGAAPAGGPNLGGGGVGGAKPAEGNAKPAASGALQGWAIVENQTDNDWQDVQLSLVSGRPISFIQDLYQPLYVPRPVVQPELYASLRPQTYDAGLAGGRPMVAFDMPAQAPATPPAAAAGAMPMERQLAASQNRARDQQEFAKKAESLREAGADKDLGGIEVTSSVGSLASAAKVGELFQYTVGSVSLPRQTSAMIPVVTDSVEVEKVSIYNLNVLPKNPLLGARVKNTTGKHLLQGPITVLDGGAYAGDARIDDLPPGQERLVSYGVDQQINVQAINNEHRSALTSGKIVKGVLHLTHKDVMTQDYVAENKGDKDKVLVIEHARPGGGWKLVEPAKADETTDNLYRFKGAVAAGKGTKLTVQQEWVRLEEVRVLDLNSNAIVAYSRSGSIPEAVRDALVKAIELRQAQAETDRQVRQKQQQINTISTEQARIRENLKTVAQNTEYYTRLVKKLDEQEGQIEGLQKEITTLQQKADQQRKALEDYVNGLNVG